MRCTVGLVLLFAAAASAALAQSAENEGFQALDQKNYPAAIRIFGKIAADDPKNFAAWFNLALACESALGKDADSIEHYQRALEVKPEHCTKRAHLQSWDDLLPECEAGRRRRAISRGLPP